MKLEDEEEAYGKKDKVVRTQYATIWWPICHNMMTNKKTKTKNNMISSSYSSSSFSCFPTKNTVDMLLIHHNTPMTYLLVCIHFQISSPVTLCQTDKCNTYQKTILWQKFPGTLISLIPSCGRPLFYCVCVWSLMFLRQKEELRKKVKSGRNPVRCPEQENVICQCWNFVMAQLPNGRIIQWSWFFLRASFFMVPL